MSENEMRKKVLYVFFIIMVLTAIVCKLLSVFSVDFYKEDLDEDNELKITVEKDNNEKVQDNQKPLSEKTAYLTFDDGPSKNTYKVLEILDKYDIKVSFFVIGTNITPEYEELLKSMEEDGHVIGIHTFSHKYNYIYTSASNYIEDFNKAYQQLNGILEKPPAIYRFPGGSCNCYVGPFKSEIVRTLKSRGFTYYDWHVSGEDSVGNPSSDMIIQNVLKDVDGFGNPVILLHDSSINKNTVDALERIILGLKDKGYGFGVLENNL